MEILRSRHPFEDFADVLLGDTRLAGNLSLHNVWTDAKCADEVWNEEK